MSQENSPNWDDNPFFDDYNELQPMGEVREKILAQEKRVVEYLIEKMPEGSIRALLSDNIAANVPLTCMELAGQIKDVTWSTDFGDYNTAELVSAYHFLHEVDNIAYHMDQPDDFYQYYPVYRLQGNILLNKYTTPGDKQVLIDATEELIGTEGIDFTDPHSAFDTMELMRREEILKLKNELAMQIFNECFAEYNSDEPMFNLLRISTCHSIVHDDRIPYMSGVKEVIDMLGIPEDYYLGIVNFILETVRKK